MDRGPSSAQHRVAPSAVVLLVLALALVQVPACSSEDFRFFSGGSSAASTSSSGRDRGSDTLIVGRSIDIVGLDPARFTDKESVEVCEQIYEHLVRLRADGQGVEPALATAWEVSVDGRAWTFH